MTNHPLYIYITVSVTVAAEKPVVKGAAPVFAERKGGASTSCYF
jgi:hypothetical protein